ncbi:flavin-containing monooxygenase [Arthrobacter sulfonylureivorans]|uniref:flavin-containing monooxygenase n=1 Tax=Arthrobacter sulfonylureivorans TaxID=2486855 RepID=UPI0039E50D5C
MHQTTQNPAPAHRLDTEVMEDVDVLISGAGLAGLGLAVHLARSGKHSFLMIDRGHDVGGTWRDNTYPGIHCDVPSHLYSYSFRPNPHWSMVRAPGGEIYEYMRQTAQEEGVLPHCRFNTALEDASWSEDQQRWIIRTSQGVYRSRFFVPAMGLLVNGKTPNVPGIEDFQGEMFHSAAWRHDVPLQGKRIGVVGTGASAIQIIPEMAKVASELVVFQRSAAYVLPRMNRPYTDAEKGLFARDPDALQEHRQAIYWQAENTYAEKRGVAPAMERATAAATQFRESQIADPELREKLTPDYAIGCKRVLFSDDYFATLNQDHVLLEDSAVVGVEGNAVSAASGAAYDLDVLILATGFDAYNPPYARLIHGLNGTSLEDKWADGLQAFQTMTVNGYPNMFILSAPAAATGHTSVFYTVEAQLDHVMEALDWCQDRDVSRLEVQKAAEEEFGRELHELGRGTVWLDGGCSSWYLDPRNGRLTLVWPDFSYAFRETMERFQPDAYMVRFQEELITSTS